MSNTILNQRDFANAHVINRSISNMCIETNTSVFEELQLDKQEGKSYRRFDDESPEVQIDHRIATLRRKVH